MDVKDRVVFVAGALNDVGEAVSLRLAKGGATIVVADSDREGLAELESKIKNSGGDVQTIVVNMTSSTEVETAVNRIADEKGRIDVLANCMDISEKASVTDTVMDRWQTLIDGNLTSIFLFTKAVITHMKSKGYGRIVNINDFDYLGMSGSSSYSTIKSGVFGLTRSLALELAKEGITVNTVVKGDLQQNDVELSEENYANAAKRMPVNKLGTTEDIAYAVSLFASESSSYITGQTLFVCGGKSLYSSMSV